jgi:signal transduction histidine kinase
VTRSLRVRLAISVVAVVAAALLALSLVLHAVFARALVRQFDARLLGDAVAIAGMAEDDAQGPEFEAESLPEFERRARPAYFEAWLDDGGVLARSPSLTAGDLARAAPGVGADVILPDGRAGRAIYVRQPLRIEDEPTIGAATPRASTRFVTVAVARGTEEVAGTLASVRLWMLVLALLTLLGASAAALAAVSLGLRSTRALAAEIAELDATRLDRGLVARGVPDEIAPVVAKINELLARVRESLAREKRFTADVSHELRTPLAALRTTLDVTASRERSPAEYRAAIDQVNVVAQQMQALCENLLSLARLDAGPVAVRPADVALRALVQSCWRLFEGRARARGVSFENEIDAAAIVATDPDQLRVIVSNLLSNATAYTAAGGTIRARRSADPRALLQVHDSGPPIPPEVLPHIFERFFRGDATRSDGVHCGIGLALARGVADALGLSVAAENTHDGGVAFTVSLR